MPSMTKKNVALIVSAIAKLEALCDTRPGIECSVDKGAKVAVRPYLQSWVIPILERLLDPAPYALYRDKHILSDAERDAFWAARGKPRCGECGRRAPWSHYPHLCSVARFEAEQRARTRGEVDNQSAEYRHLDDNALTDAISAGYVTEK
jgi:hypothetical protein